MENRAEILCIGTEILLGNIVNTNAQVISQGLAELGIYVYRSAVVGDNAGRRALAKALGPLCYETLVHPTAW